MVGGAAKLELEFYQGEDYICERVHKTSGLDNATVVDITGWTIKATIKVRATDTTPVLEVDAVLTNPSLGEYEVRIPATDSEDLDVGKYAIDIWRLDNGAKTVLGKGKLEVLQPVRTPA
jgi:hypothetical protein